MSNSVLIRAAPVLFVVLWATGFVVARLSAGHVEPLTFLAIRFPLAALVMLVIAVQQRAHWPDRRHAMHAGVAGGLIHAVYLGPIYWAVAHGMPGGVAALIVGLQPLITAVMAALILGETFSLRHWLGLAAGIMGVALVLAPKLSFVAASGITPLTTGLTLLGTLGIAAGTVYQKKFATGLHIASGGFWQYVGGSLIVGMGALVLEDFGFDGSFEAWFALGWAVVVLSTGAIMLLMVMIREREVARVSSFIFLVPVVAALMTYALFGETLTPVQIGGMVLCAAAVLMVNRPD
jgi:drug/metabolite transporter (DMT)-like permease